MVWESRDSGTYSVFWSRRENGGWSAIQKLSSEPYSELPDIAIGPLGIIHVVYQSKQDNTGQVYYVESSDGFITSRKTLISQHLSDSDIETAAEAAVTGSDPETEQVSNRLQPRLTADANDRAHVVWNAPSPYGIYYRIQNANGDFDSTIKVSTGHRDQAPDIAYSPSGSLGIVWGAYETRNAAFAEYVNGQPGLKRYAVDQGLEQSLLPRIAVDCNGLFYFAFQGKETAAGDWNIYVRTYDSATNQFGKRVTIADAGSEEATPAIALNNVGAIVYTNKTRGKVMGATSNPGITCSTSGTPTPPPTGTEHIPANDPRITYNGTWASRPDDKASDNQYMRCGGSKGCKKDWSAGLNFTGGTRVEWETAYAKTYGKVQVLIDGKLFEQIDLCSQNRNSTKPKFASRTYVLVGNANTLHSIKIRALGSHTNCSPDDSNFVAVDGFNIIR